MTLGSEHYEEIWCVDFEFRSVDGNLPEPVCLVARELRSGRLHRVWRDELRGMRTPPYRIDSRVLVVAFFASAELGCHLSLGWNLPQNILDLYVEFRRLSNGISVPSGRGLLGALVYYGLNAMDAAEKEEMRDLILGGDPWRAEQQRAILDYCQQDVEVLPLLLQAMEPSLDLPRALVRGSYMGAVARIEHAGIPIDTDKLSSLRRHSDSIKRQLIDHVDSSFRVFEDGCFRSHLFENYLARSRIPWPRLPSGALALDDKTFKEMSRRHSEVGPLRELRSSLSQLRLRDLAVGSDGRNRCLISPFSSVTGRNQPSNSKFIFGGPAWLRRLIRPRTGHALAYIDWSQQEFGVAAALSADSAMVAAYESGDPYLAFAIQAGAAPPGATRSTHLVERERFKACLLGVQYAMGPLTLAERIGQPAPYAEELLRMHRRTFPRFWKWSNAALDTGFLSGEIWTTFGWTLRIGTATNPRTLRNFPMQANGAEMLRLACRFATEQGVRVCAPVHDALLVEAPTPDIHAVVHTTQSAMARASRIVLSGLELRTDAKIVVYPHRFEEDRGSAMWELVDRLILDAERELA